MLSLPASKPSTVGEEGVQQIIARFKKDADQLKARELANDVLNPTLENQNYVTALKPGSCDA